jgi:hypothetical protein
MLARTLVALTVLALGSVLVGCADASAPEQEDGVTLEEQGDEAADKKELDQSGVLPALPSTGGGGGCESGSGLTVQSVCPVRCPAGGCN